MWRLSLAHALLDFFNLIFNVPIGHENVRPAVIVVIEKEAAEAKRDQGCAANFRAGSFVDEQAIPFVVIERDHLVGEVRNNQAGTARTVIIGGVDTHSGARNSVFAEGNSGGHGFLFKRTVALVQIKLIWLGVVGQKNVGPTVAVVVENREAQGL